ncbi:MAG: hypothetical protein IJ333_08135 [Clostridia bacterium]|nr:hypothetical protein [Clostridia bacterium]
MNKITVDFKRAIGKMKPMHAVNNGPVHKFAEDQRVSNLQHFIDAGIPYMRNHDASFCSTYGGEHTVDVHAIFPHFDADPLDPASYDFIMTDEYMRVMELTGGHCFYRLGSKIEHGIKKYGTLPPKDFHKWAVICEHIIRHYTEGWAEGFHYDIEYWEIWNEPDLDPDDATHKRTWGGTRLEFYKFYQITASHLKSCFPHLKIGGPALARTSNWDWLEGFLALGAPLDFFSWHVYGATVEKTLERVIKIRKLLDQYGYNETESILNEWNYVRSFHGDEWAYSLQMEKELKGAAFIASHMCACQNLPLDMLMYYDARPGGMNGMFAPYQNNVCLKGYYPFKMFNELYKLGTSIETIVQGDNLYSCAAVGKDGSAVMLSYFNDEDSSAPKEVTVELKNFKGKTATVYILDETHNMEPVWKETYAAQTTILHLNIPNFTTYLLRFE